MQRFNFFKESRTAQTYPKEALEQQELAEQLASQIGVDDQIHRYVD